MASGSFKRQAQGSVIKAVLGYSLDLRGVLRMSIINPKFDTEDFLEGSLPDVTPEELINELGVCMCLCICV